MLITFGMVFSRTEIGNCRHGKTDVSHSMSNQYSRSKFIQDATWNLNADLLGNGRQRWWKCAWGTTSLFEVPLWLGTILLWSLKRFSFIFIITVILESAYLDVGYPKLSPMSLYPINDMLDVFRWSLHWDDSIESQVAVLLWFTNFGIAFFYSGLFHLLSELFYLLLIVFCINLIRIW